MEKIVSHEGANSQVSAKEPTLDAFDLLRERVDVFLLDQGYADLSNDGRMELIIAVQQSLHLALYHSVGLSWDSVAKLLERQAEVASAHHEKLVARELAALKTSSECLDALSARLNMRWGDHIYIACEAHINRLAMKDTPGHKMKFDIPAFREEWVAPLVHQFIVDNGYENCELNVFNVMASFGVKIVTTECSINLYDVVVIIDLEGNEELS